MTTTESHLEALTTSLSHERARLAAAKTDSERQVRSLRVRQYEREIASERAFLGLTDEPEQTDAELLAALGL